MGTDRDQEWPSLRSDWQLLLDHLEHQNTSFHEIRSTRMQENTEKEKNLTLKTTPACFFIELNVSMCITGSSCFICLKFMPSCTHRENMKSEKELKLEDGKSRDATPLCQMISRNLVVLLLLCYVILLLLLDTVFLTRSHKTSSLCCSCPTTTNPMP